MDKLSRLKKLAKLTDEPALTTLEEIERIDSNIENIQTDIKTVSDSTVILAESTKDTITKLNDSLINKIDNISLTPGPKGEKGDKGDIGMTGPSGKDGKDGINGIDGKDGINGRDGVDGIDGKDGSPDTSKDIADKLNREKEILNIEVIKGYKNIEGKVDKIGNHFLYGNRGAEVYHDSTLSGKGTQGNPLSANLGSADGKVSRYIGDTTNYLDAKLQEGIQAVLFDPTPTLPTATTGLTYYDQTEHTLATELENGVTIQHGQEMHIYGKNVSGAPILNGTPVSVVSNNGSFTAFSTVDITTQAAYAFVGLATQDIAINGFGYVTTSGKVHDLNTSAFDEGKPVYVSPTGTLTKTFPTVPNYIINVGVVEYKHANHGIINVISAVVPKLNDLSDVDGTATTVDGQIPVWHNTGKYFDFDKNINDYVRFENKEASNNIRNSNDSEVTAGSANTTYFKAKTIKFNQPLKGTARFLYDLGCSQTSTTAYGRIYRNGVPLGSERATVSTYGTQSEDIIQDWAINDTCELWIKCSSPYATAMGVKNFRIAYDNLTMISTTNS